MNILIATEHNISADLDLTLIGIRNLIENGIAPHVNWVLYDGNPDLCYLESPKSHRIHLKSNSFRHQSLRPFELAVLSANVFGHPFEELFGCLTKEPIPLWAIGVDAPRSQELSKLEAACFRRNTTKVTVKNAHSSQWLKSQGINATVLPCPSLFSANLYSVQSMIIGGPNQQFAKTRVSPLAIWLEACNSHKQIDEQLVRQMCEWISQLQIPYEIYCGSIDSFMRFSTMFPNQVHYSYDPKDYLNWFSSTSLLITIDLTIAPMALSHNCPVIYVGSKRDGLELLPYVFPTKLDDVTTVLDRLTLDKKLPLNIKAWINQVQKEYEKALFGFSTTATSFPSFREVAEC